MITIEVHFSWAEYRNWTSLTYTELHKRMSNIKKVTKYKVMFYIDDMYNKALVRVTFKNDCLILWDDNIKLTKIKGDKISTEDTNKIASIVSNLYWKKRNG
jgi:hypothetical protein